MPELKLGTKYECYSCSTKFYDLGKSEPLCPKCGANQKDATGSDALAVSQASRRKRKADLAKAIDVDEEVAIDDIGDEEMVGPELEGDLGDDAEEEEEDLDDED